MQGNAGGARRRCDQLPPISCPRPVGTRALDEARHGKMAVARAGVVVEDGEMSINSRRRCSMMSSQAP